VEIETRGILKGRIADVDTGEAIRGAKLRVLEETRGQFMAASDSNGLYSLVHLEPGTYTVVCEALGFETASQRVFVADASQSGISEVNFFIKRLSEEVLPRTGNVRGFLLNGIGNPVLGAELTLRGRDFERKCLTTMGYFDFQRGNFEFLGVPEGEYRLIATKPGMLVVETPVKVRRGVDNWVGDLRMKAVPISKPPEIESLSIAPVSFEAGGSLTVTIKIADPIGRNASVSANIVGPGGANIGFSVDATGVPGEFCKLFPRWESIGTFKLFNITVWDTEKGQAHEFPVTAEFEVVPKVVPPLTGESAIFKVPR
jgi:hypothetical protein